MVRGAKKQAPSHEMCTCSTHPLSFGCSVLEEKKKKTPTKMRLNCWDVLYRSLIQPIILCALIRRRHIIRRPAFPLKMSKNYTQLAL